MSQKVTCYYFLATFSDGFPWPDFSFLTAEPMNLLYLLFFQRQYVKGKIQVQYQIAHL